jgi:hypothetical protein
MASDKMASDGMEMKNEGYTSIIFFATNSLIQSIIVHESAQDAYPMIDWKNESQNYHKPIKPVYSVNIQ